MKKDNLFTFVGTGVLTDDFFSKLKSEVALYKEDVESRKDVKTIYGESEVDDVLFDRQRLIVLLDCYLEGRILEWDLEYILSFVELSFEIIEEKVEEVLFNFSDPYLGFPINAKNVKEALLFLNEAVDVMELKDEKVLGSREGYRSIFRL